jgi:hypothetical protein
MARYPFGRNSPSSSSTHRDVPTVISASGRVDASPSLGLVADTPSTLRARNPSPRNPDGAFSNDTSSYPSPAAQSSRSRGKKKQMAEDQASEGRVPVNLASSVSIPRYDSRGYPTKERPPDYRDSPESSTSTRTDRGLRPTLSAVSLYSVSSTAAGASEGEESRFLSPERRSYYTSHANDTSTSLHPPTVDYSLSTPGYSPYDHANAGIVPYGTAPGPSLYGDSRLSVNTMVSGNSRTGLREYDPQMNRGVSMSKKGVRRHLFDMVRGLILGS